jgi:hypothetical protein
MLKARRSKLIAHRFCAALRTFLPAPAPNPARAESEDDWLRKDLSEVLAKNA